MVSLYSDRAEQRDRLIQMSKLTGAKTRRQKGESVPSEIGSVERDQH